MRRIQDILDLRRDISPFLVHLTRASEITGLTGRENLHAIFNESRLRARDGMSDVQFGGDKNITDLFKQRFLQAVSFSETPLDEVHCLLEIERRRVNLEPYGVVFMKERLAALGVSPSLYLNNIAGDKDDMVRDLFNLSESNPELAEKLLPLFSIFGQKVRRPTAAYPPQGSNDWRWEREWRFPANRGVLNFDGDNDVFIGLCPHEEIAEFEASFPLIRFVDPRRPLRWYSSKLIERRRVKGMSQAVV